MILLSCCLVPVSYVAWVLGSATEGCPGHGPANLLVESAAEYGFQWSPDVLGWERREFGMVFC